MRLHRLPVEAITRSNGVLLLSERAQLDARGAPR
jgi:hypothetical protein